MRDVFRSPGFQHVTPFFDLVSWTTWQVVGRDVRWAPLGYTIASVLPWTLVLGLFGTWLIRETRSHTAAFLSLAVVSQSPLVMETMGWYSASSFSWAIAGILLAMLGAGGIASRRGRSLGLIVTGTVLGPAATSLGVLSVPLSIGRAVLDRKASPRDKLLVFLAAIGGFTLYLALCHLQGIEFFSTVLHGNGGMTASMAGPLYVLSVPGRLLLPSALGVPASSCAAPQPQWLSVGAGILAFMILAGLALWLRKSWSGRLILVGSAMIYLGYGLTYPARAGLVKRGAWTEFQLLYQWGSRYHVLPLLGLATVLATLLAAWKPIRRCDSRPALPALLGIILGCLMMIVHAPT